MPFWFHSMPGGASSVSASRECSAEPSSTSLKLRSSPDFICVSICARNFLPASVWGEGQREGEGEGEGQAKGAGAGQGQA